jgi:single-stranded-DNA-specific exonuclease
VVERHGRPALVVSRDGNSEEAHGSGRSIPAFHLLDALESCAPLFTRFGGHAYAVGFSLPSSRVEELRAQLDAYARTRLTLADFEPTLNIDAELPLDAITPEMFEALKKMEPFGAGNPEPVFSANARMTTSVKIMKEKHVRMNLAPGGALAASEAGNGWRRSLAHKAVGWRLAERVAKANLLPGDQMEIAFTLDHNEHPEFGGIELSLRDFKSSSAQAAGTLA